MPRYYFHIRDGNVPSQDPEGAEFDTVELARIEAAKAARELLSERVLHGELVDGQSFELTGEDGRVEEVVKFKDVMNLAE